MYQAPFRRIPSDNNWAKLQAADKGGSKLNKNAKIFNYKKQFQTPQKGDQINEQGQYSSGSGSDYSR